MRLALGVLAGLLWAATAAAVTGDGYHPRTGILADVRLWLPWKPFDLSPCAVLGYRVVAFDRSPDEAEVDLQLRGPVAGAGFVF